VDHFFADKEVRQQIEEKQFYQVLDKTKEWAENNYYRLPIQQQNADLVKVNDFWIDWARHTGDGEFRSAHFAQATHNFTEAMFALALLDLPVKSPDHQFAVVDQSIKIQTAGPVIALYEQIEAAGSPDETTPILVSQNFFRHGERHQMVNGEQVDLFVRDEFLQQTVYGCHLVVTNPTSSRQKLDVLQQVPVGAIPVGGAKTTQAIRLLLEPYQTQTLEYYFYFPATGDFTQFPVHVTRGDELVAAAPIATFHVVETLSQVDRKSWDYVSQFGSEQDVLEYLREQNLQSIQLHRIAFRMSNADFFRQTLDILRQRHVYDHTLWSYAIRHNNTQAIGEYLAHSDAFVAQCGDVLVSPLLIIDPVRRRTYEHLEYHPLVNARAHRVGQERQILNDRFYQQYLHWLKLLTYLRTTDDMSRLVTVDYLLLQDRVEEAIAQFHLIDATHLDTRLQYDYFQAYLAMSQSDTSTAREIAERYASYPVDRWRNMFTLVRNHLDEIEGKGSFAVDSRQRDQRQDEIAAAQPSFDFAVEARKIRLNHRNLSQAEIRYYLMDIELLFSRNPFVQQHEGQFAYIAPNLVEQIDISAGEGTLVHELPASLHNRNVLIEVVTAGQRQSQPYFSNTLNVQMIENYGQLRVAHAESRQPLSPVYCKVYARLNDGRTIFYKDGYTDLRGRFDYATLSTNTIETVERFAVLVLSDEHGAMVREVNPPQR
jgi:hypothetical protein